jgi:hypothetical protein
MSRLKVGSRISIGQRFGRWIVLADAPRWKHQARFLCRCDCGTDREVFAFVLLDGTSTSCGCFMREKNGKLIGERSRTHGETIGRGPSIEYSTWVGMIDRCENPRNKSFPDYGGRGIRVCPEWRDSFPGFLAEVGRRPGPEFSIDRIDNSRGYEPGNVRWATRLQQNRNRRPARRAEQVVA